MKKILLIEDDLWQIDSIKESIEEAARGRSMRVCVESVNSEYAARQVVESASADFDAYIVDLMVPWFQEHDGSPPPVNQYHDVMSAGLRVVEMIAKKRDKKAARNSVAPPILLYTVANSPNVTNVTDASRRIFHQVKDENDRAIAERVISLLST